MHLMKFVDDNNGNLKELNCNAVTLRRSQAKSSPVLLKLPGDVHLNATRKPTRYRITLIEVYNLHTQDLNTLHGTFSLYLLRRHQQDLTGATTVARTETLTHALGQ